MCGIAGCFKTESPLNIEQRVLEMQDYLTHRGPDSLGHELIDDTCLAHTRLSIIDLSPNGHQPMFNRDGSVIIVLNGEIYNFKSLKKNHLSDYPFQSETDTEVVLAAYDKWGLDFLQYIDGMFALALYDKRRKIKLIARDRFGKKPIYYFSNEKEFWFSSEIRSLLKSNCTRKVINKDVLGEYLQYQTVHQPQTMIKDVFMLEPGTALLVGEKSNQKITYFKDEKPEQFNSSSNLQSIFEESVAKRLVSDVPLAILLSAGIDSNLILAAASKHQKVNAFTIGFKEKGFDESALAEKSAQHFGANFHKIILEPHDFLHTVETALEGMDHPSGDGPNTYTICREVKKAGFTVALSGLGGDEVFLGYPHHKMVNWSLHSKFLKFTPQSLLSGINSIIKHRKISKLQDLKRVNGSVSSALSAFRSNYNQSDLAKNFDIQYTTYKEVKANNISQQISQIEIDNYLHDTLLRDADQMSMAHAIELRNPFLDKKLVSYVQINNLQDSNQPKKYLYQELGKSLPEYIINKPKTGFTFPWDHWMRNELREFCEKRVTFLEETKLFKKGSIINIWNQFMNGSKQYTWSRVWPLVCLSNWIKLNDIEF